MIFFYISTYTFMSNLVRDQEFRGKRRDQVKIISQKYFGLNTVCCMPESLGVTLTYQEWRLDWSFF